MIRIALPQHLQTLARCEPVVSVSVEGRVTQAAVLDALEASFPMLRGTIREHVSLKRRPRVRFYASGKDLSHEPPDAELPGTVASGEEPFMIVGAVAGG